MNSEEMYSDNDYRNYLLDDCYESSFMDDSELDDDAFCFDD